MSPACGMPRDPQLNSCPAQAHSSHGRSATATTGLLHCFIHMQGHGPSTPPARTTAAPPVRHHQQSATFLVAHGSRMNVASCRPLLGPCAPPAVRCQPHPASHATARQCYVRRAEPSPQWEQVGRLCYHSASTTVAPPARVNPRATAPTPLHHAPPPPRASACRIPLLPTQEFACPTAAGTVVPLQSSPIQDRTNVAGSMRVVRYAGV